MPLISDWTSIDVSKDFSFGKPRKTGVGSTIIPFQVLDKNTGQYVPFIHQTPQMLLPFGLTERDSSFTMNMSFSGVFQNEDGSYSGDDPLLFKYFEFIRSIDEMLVDCSLKHSMDWFKKNYERKKVEDILSRNTKASLTEPMKYSPTFPTKLKTTEGKDSMILKTEFYDDEQNTIEANTFQEIAARIPKGSKVVSLLEAPFIWYSNTGFGLSFKVAQTMVFKKDTFRGCAILIPPTLQRAIVSNFVVPEEKKRLRDDEIFPENECKIRNIESE